MTQAKEVMSDMNLLFYAPVTDGVGERLQGVVKVLVPEENLEIHRTIDSLSRRLRRPTYDVAVAVFLAPTKEDLLEILSIKDLIWNLRIILILPDREEDTIAQGHTLRPRFLTYADGNFADVAVVLRTMLANHYLGNIGSKKQGRRYVEQRALTNGRKGDMTC